MGPIVIITIAVLLVFISLVALGCCQAAKDDIDNDAKQQPSPDLFKTGLAMQYVQLCKDYGVVPEWTDEHLMLFKDDYIFHSNAKPVYFNNSTIGYVSFNKVIKITGSSLKAHYEENVLLSLQAGA